MKRPILIIASGVVVISLLLLVNEKWLKETSAPKTADKQQKEESVQQGTSPTEQKTTAKPTSKPPVYDLTNKAHWYDPETTVGLYESKTLAEWLEPFKPKPEEFQSIAQYETSRKKLKESLSEDEYYSVEGRKRLIDGILKLNKKLREDLREERAQFYAEVQEPETGYYYTWEVLTVNGISDDRVSEFRELADEFNQQMHGIPLFRAERRVGRYSPEDWDIDSAEQERIAQAFRDRIEKEFGKQVLDDIFDIGDSLFFMSDLDEGDDPTRHLGILFDPKRQERLKTLYDVDFEIVDDDEVRIREIEKEEAERERLAKREMKLMEEWLINQGPNQAGPREPSIGWIP